MRKNIQLFGGACTRKVTGFGNRFFTTLLIGAALAGAALADDPGITGQPLSQTYNVGSSVTFAVTASGTSPFFYQWRKEGTNLPGATVESLTLTNVQWSDSGNYSVVVSNSLSSITSSVAKLLVIAPVTPDGFSPTLDYGVWVMAVQTDGRVVLGGEFSLLNGQERRFGRLYSDGTLDESFNPVVGQNPSSTAILADGKILVGGSGYLIRLDADGIPDSTFNPGVNNWVESLTELADGKILVTGYFTNLCGQVRNRIGRLNADGTLDATFNPDANKPVQCAAVQPNGEILVGGNFTNLCGEARNFIGRLNADGTLDRTFHAELNGNVFSVAVQVDGKILAGGLFTVAGGQPRIALARLNPDGTLDGAFDPGIVLRTNDYTFVDSIALQTDGKILVSGLFESIGPCTQRGVVRLNADGTLDHTFDVGVGSGAVHCMALQADGKLLVGGEFHGLGEIPLRHLGRLNNTEPATQGWRCEDTSFTWLRGGTSPELWRTTFEISTNGSNWVSLGAGTRIPGGWQLSGILFPDYCAIRARGFINNGKSSSWYVETIWQGVVPVRKRMLVEHGSYSFRTNQFSFNAVGSDSQSLVIEGSTNLLQWIPILTNPPGSGPIFFSDPAALNFKQRYYRGRLE